MAKVITVTSGKGGVGKTSLSLNLSLCMAASGHRVCLFDADLGLANVNILTGISPEYGLEDVIRGERSLEQIMVQNFQGIDIIPGSSGVERMADLIPEESDCLIKAFLELKDYDYFILDTSAGISAQVLSFCTASHEMILVVTPEPTSLTDAYALLKVLSGTGRLPKVRVVVNQVKTAAAARKTYDKLKDTVLKFLSVRIIPLGVLAHDRHVPAAIISQVPFFILFPDSIASKCIQSLTRKLTRDPDRAQEIPMEMFWVACLKFFRQHQKDRKPTGRPLVAPGGKSQKIPDQPSGLLPGSTSLPSLSQVDAADLKKGLASLEAQVSQMVGKMAQITLLLNQVLKQEKPGKTNSANVDAGLTASNLPAPDPSREKARKDPISGPQSNGIPLPSPPKPGKVFLDFEGWIQNRSQARRTRPSDDSNRLAEHIFHRE